MSCLSMPLPVREVLAVKPPIGSKSRIKRSREVVGTDESVEESKDRRKKQNRSSSQTYREKQKVKLKKHDSLAQRVNELEADNRSLQKAISGSNQALKKTKADNLKLLEENHALKVSKNNYDDLKVLVEAWMRCSAECNLICCTGGQQKELLGYLLKAHLNATGDSDLDGTQSAPDRPSDASAPVCESLLPLCPICENAVDAVFDTSGICSACSGGYNDGFGSTKR